MVIPYTEQYKDQFLDLAKQMYDESNTFKSLEFNPERVLSIVEHSHAYCSLYLKDDKVIGSMLGFKTAPFFSSELIGQELALYVNKEHRGGMAAIRLIKHFEDWCEQNNCKQIYGGSSVEVATDLTQKLYEKRGFRVRGFSAYKDI